MGDMWIVCWPRRWESEERGGRRGERKGIRERREVRWNGSGVDGRSCRSGSERISLVIDIGLDRRTLEARSGHPPFHIPIPRPKDIQPNATKQ